MQVSVRDEMAHDYKNIQAWEKQVHDKIIPIR